jgi:hypothetical protein
MSGDNVGMRFAQAASRDSIPNAARWRARERSCDRRDGELKIRFKIRIARWNGWNGDEIWREGESYKLGPQVGFFFEISGGPRGVWVMNNLPICLIRTMSFSLLRYF